MADHFVNLNCPNCGGRLEIYGDMDRFACGYCGSEMLVSRRGGTVALKAVTEAIKQVQVGTDKTAAELAIIRLERECDELSEQLKSYKLSANRSVGGARLFMMIAMLIPGMIFFVAGGVGVVLFVLYFVFVYWFSCARIRVPSAAPKGVSLENRLLNVQLQLEHNRATVSGNKALRPCFVCQNGINELAKYCTKCGAKTA